MPLEYDVVVLGSGPAGEKAAFQAAKLRKRVALVDRGTQLGGNCLHTGTIPSKTLRETVLHIAASRTRNVSGLTTRLSKDVTLHAMMESKESVIRGQQEVLERKLERNDVAVFTGTGRFLDPHRIEVLGDDGARREITAGFVVLATGSRPARHPDIPFDDDNIHDSDTILKLDVLPRTLTVVGAGVIGCEYACMFAALGTKVTLMDTRPRVLDVADREISELLVARMRDHGVTMRLGEQVERIHLERQGRVVATTVKIGRAHV